MSKKITLNDDKLKKLITDKGILITKGRKVSEEIEVLEKEMEKIDGKIKEIEKTINLDEFHEKEKTVSEKVEIAIAEMKEIQKEIHAKLLISIPPELGQKYDEVKKKKEDMETERNKIAIKAQKYNDKIIPLGRKLMKPYLEDIYDDYETIKMEDGEIVCTIFSHLQDFKNNFKKK